MTHIALTTKNNAYRYLWLKSVTGFNPAVHCARCLIGEYSALLPRHAVGKIEVDAPLDIPGEVFYLCGVTSRYDRNLHVAFQRGEGHIEIDTGDIYLVISGAVRLPINPLPQDAAIGLTSDFTRCRNYQFGFALSQAARMSADRP